MGATSNNSRLADLQERKKHIEETLAKRNLELRELCIQEAEMTGITPPEMPLEIGETPPTIRRIVGTTFQLPENLVQNSSNKDELIQSIELQMQLHANLAEAALGLANGQNLSKTIKRQHRSEYQKHKNICLDLQEKLAFLKEKQLTEQPKQRKKPRSVSDCVKQHPVDGHTSINNNNNDINFNADVRHSLRYMKTSEINAQSMESYRHQDPRIYPRPTSELPYSTQQKYDDIFSGIYSLSLNGYSRYMERQENHNNVSPSYNMNTYQYNINREQFQQNSQYYAPHYSAQHSSQTSEHHRIINQQNHMQMHNLYYPQRSPQHHSPHLSSHPKYVDYSNDFSKYNYGNVSPQRGQNFTHSLHGHKEHKQTYHNDSLMMNPHQIQPHQQYEHTNVVTSGLGGCWRKNERGELVWTTSDVKWHRDKRFGSLDRRKNKRITKMTNIDNKSATLGGMPSSQDQVLNNIPIKPVHVISRRSSDRQLVRTQSLGSVGAQTLDNVYPSDDNSSCGSENRNRSNSHTLQKSKKKEWVETALDSPVSNKIHPSSPQFKPLPIPPSALAPEEKYFVNNSPTPMVNHTPPPVASPLLPKPPLEIPAESNPSPRAPDTKTDFFSSPITNENFTVVEAGKCKPYHEETKPFEMSDFYKYSTKFKKNLKQENNSPSPELGSPRRLDRPPEQNMNHTYSPKRLYDNSSVENSRGFNINFDASTNRQTDLSRWYEDQHASNQGNRPDGRITDTLV